jgi:transcriptional regulator with XRE-family HTH domain
MGWQEYAGMTWWQYVVKVIGTDNQSEIARRVGLSQPTVRAWKTSAPKPESLRKFAEATGRPILEAQIVLGWITPEQARELC